jgi:hypothetical protein
MNAKAREKPSKPKDMKTNEIFKAWLFESLESL